MTYPVFASGDVLNASDMNAVGLWLVKTFTVTTTATTQDITSCFSSTYSNYRIEVDALTASAPIGLALQFLVGTTPTAANYYSSGLDVSLTGVVTGTGLSNDAVGINNLIGNTTPSGGFIELYGPQKAIRTSFHSGGIDARTTGNPFRMSGGFQDSNTQFDGIRILTNSATTITGGTFRVYGYRN